MQDIQELNLKEFEDCLAGWGKPSFHAKQIFSWIYQKKIKDFLLMSDIPADLRKLLEENFRMFSLKLTKTVASKDGTEKFLFELKDKNFIESVSIPAKDRVTGCISTQVGCKFCCSFCASGLSGFRRNLTCAEIIGQALYLKNHLQKKLTHIVFMGTGEPLDNYANLLKAIRMINSPSAFNIGARRITISTSGIIPAIKKLADEGLQVELSVSLHAADDKTRSRIMPVNKKYPLIDLIATCRDYVLETGRQITFEYILFKGVNSDLQSARSLSTILRGLNCKVNLIPANPITELKVEPPGKLEILFFRDTLIKQGIKVTLRKPRGQDIEAACGQLRLSYEGK